MTDRFDKPIENKLCANNGRNEDINAVLLSEAKTILSDKLKEDDSTTVSSSTTISVDHNLRKNGVSDKQWLDEYVMQSFMEYSPASRDYHKSEIKNVNFIIIFILVLLGVFSLITIIAVAVFVYLEKDTGAIISLVTGGVIDTILGFLAQMFNSTLKSKKSYFDAENDLSKFNKMLLLIQVISDNDNKDNIIMDILRSHFNIRSNTTNEG